MCRDAKLIEVAFANTKLSQHSFPMAAVVVRGSRIISIGVNKFKTHPRQRNPLTGDSTSIHAELSAIIGCSEEQLDGATIYVARRLANDTSAMARPCKTCLAVLRQVGIEKIVYTINKGYATERI